MTLRRLSATVRTPRGWTPIPSPPLWWRRVYWSRVATFAAGMLTAHLMWVFLP